MEDRVIVLIPAYKPEKSFTGFISNLREKFKYVVIVNDGNDDTYMEVFNELKSEYNCILVHHYTNLGKGRALKSGFNEALHIIKENPNVQGVITADADGQHLVKDIERVKEKMLECNEELVLGARNFDLDNIPFRSKFGNKLTKNVFLWLCGLKITDTQTGLRGIPTSLISGCCTIEGERYEYETNMLLMTKEWGIKITEIEIATVYENNNKSSHFNPLLDSLKIYKTIIKYSVSSIASTIVEFIIFTLLINGGNSILLSTYVGRLISSIFNFLINRHMIFKSKGRIVAESVKYFTLVIMSGSLSAILVSRLNALWPIHAIYIKMIVDTLLYFVNYYVQNVYIFCAKKNN